MNTLSEVTFSLEDTNKVEDLLQMVGIKNDPDLIDESLSKLSGLVHFNDPRTNDVVATWMISQSSWCEYKS